MNQRLALVPQLGLLSRAATAAHQAAGPLQELASMRPAGSRHPAASAP